MGHLVLLGAGHAHLAVIEAIADLVAVGHVVTVVGPDEHHYYSGMGPGLLGGRYTAGEIRFPVHRMVEERGARFVRDKAVRIDAQSRTVHLASGDVLPYDVLSCNTGSAVSVPFDLEDADDPDIVSVKPIERLWAARERLRELSTGGTVRVAVVGGGPAAVEVAGNAWSTISAAGGAPRVTVCAGRQFMARQPKRVARLCRDALLGRGLGVVERAYARRVGRDGQGGLAVELEDGRSVNADMVFLATGVRPSPLFTDSSLPVGPDGGLLVTGYLNCRSHPEIFGGGDCIHFAPRPLARLGVYAVRQNPILAHNLRVALDGRPGREMRLFRAGPSPLMLYNLGDGSAVFEKFGMVWRGRAAMWLKDRIDRGFMRRFGVW